MTQTKKSYLNAFEKASKTSYFQDYRNLSPALPFKARNPFSGAIVELNALEATIYEFCMQWYQRYEYGDSTETPVSVYDNMRYYLMSINSNAYMELLD